MKVIETKITETCVHMRLADNIDPAKASQWIDFQVPLKDLTDPDTEKEIPLGPVSKRNLRSLRSAALLHVQRLVTSEVRNPSE